eukprot:GILJ01013067.1.p1 GENE.GILJ01013067.1~~GILJ01013067.1.p1  ORF type:complete len:241 (-),score=22.10 GILJ01013067.1:229-951(-)
MISGVLGCIFKVEYRHSFCRDILLIYDITTPHCVLHNDHMYLLFSDQDNTLSWLKKAEPQGQSSGQIDQVNDWCPPFRQESLFFLAAFCKILSQRLHILMLTFFVMTFVSIVFIQYFASSDGWFPASFLGQHLILNIIPEFSPRLTLWENLQLFVPAFVGIIHVSLAPQTPWHQTTYWMHLLSILCFVDLLVWKLIILCVRYKKGYLAFIPDRLLTPDAGVMYGVLFLLWDLSYAFGLKR